MSIICRSVDAIQAERLLVHSEAALLRMSFACAVDVHEMTPIMSLGSLVPHQGRLGFGKFDFIH